MLNYSNSREDDIDIVYLEGHLDAVTAGILSKTLGDFSDAGRYKIILDMDSVSYISSNGLKPLLEWLDATEGMSGRRKFAVCNLRGFIREVFRITGCDLKIPIYESTESAVNVFRQEF